MIDVYNSWKNKQIPEYLNEHEERSSLSADQVRRAVQRFEGVIEPEATEQLKRLEIHNSVSTVNDFKIKLQTKLNTFQSAQQNTDFKSPTYSTLPHHRKLRLGLGRLQQSRSVVSEPEQHLGNTHDHLGAVKKHLPHLRKAFRALPANLEQLHDHRRQSRP